MRYSYRIVVVLVSSNARVDDVLEVVWQGERAHDEAVRVHHAPWDRPAVRVSSLSGNIQSVACLLSNACLLFV